MFQQAESQHMQQFGPTPSQVQAQVQALQAGIIPTVVIDMGSDSVQAGFAGQDRPLSEFHAVIGRISKI